LCGDGQAERGELSIAMTSGFGVKGTCEYCGGRWASKNELHKHLRAVKYHGGKRLE
ncbi:MAG: hypothetical protein JWM47_4453, partial [Acidimicrobiales bacterium]|nr:hypothetical protein [Acidimicrobiales bacterium]